MAKTLTIVARDPAGMGVLLHADYDGELQDILDKFENPVADHVLARACSVQEIKAEIANYVTAQGAQPEVIQLIGHGRAGELDLGYGAWNDPALQPMTSFSLDSDRGTYGALKHDVKAPCRVLVLGCRVGERLGTPEVPASADGGTLLFDLSHMWRCEVLAPVDDIFASDFDPSGRFRADDAHLSRLSRAYADAVTFGTPGPEAGTVDTPAPTVALIEVIAAPAHPGARIVAPEGIPLDLTSGAAQSIAADLASWVGRESARTPILAAPEYVFAGTVDGRTRKIEVIGGGRFVRASAPGPGLVDRRVYVIDPANRPSFAQGLRRLAELAGLPDV